jgi:hypothetical protein
VPEPRWNTHRGDEWWWSGETPLAASLGGTTFCIDDLFRGSGEQLWQVLSAAHAQFPNCQIHCNYDHRVRGLLEELQENGLLRWSDAGNPHSHYARIQFDVS